MSRSSKGPWWNQTKNSWYASVAGRRISLRCQKHEKKEAVKRWAELVSGQKPIETPQRSKPLTVREVLEAFVADAAVRVKRQSLAVYEWHVAVIVKSLGHLPVQKLNPAVVLRWVCKPEWSKSYRSGLMRTLRTAFRCAVASKLLSSDPLQGLKIPSSESRGSKAALSPEAFRTILEQAGEHFGALLEFLWECGCRPGEAARLTAADVDLGRGVARLSEHKSDHTGKPRIIILSAAAVAVLKPLVLRRPSGLLFRAPRGGAWSQDALTDHADRLSRKCGIKFTSYFMRHSAATRWLKAGMPIAHTSALLGHSNTAMVSRHYGHLGDAVDALKNSLERFGG